HLQNLRPQPAAGLAPPAGDLEHERQPGGSACLVLDLEHVEQRTQADDFQPRLLADFARERLDESLARFGDAARQRPAGSRVVPAALANQLDLVPAPENAAD